MDKFDTHIQRSVDADTDMTFTKNRGHGQTADTRVHRSLPIS